jgi:hypothetical protein
VANLIKLMLFFSMLFRVLPKLGIDKAKKMRNPYEIPPPG